MTAMATADMFDFFTRLAADNDRPWFQAHKAEYDEIRARWIADIDRMIAAISVWAPEYGRLSGRDVTYRIYRDTRFSTDKTPYKTYISSLLTPRGRKAAMAGFYVSAGAGDELTGLFGGLWHPDAAALRKMRRAIVDNIEEFEGIISDPVLVALFPEWCGATLKTIPKGWPKDHPQAPLLRLLNYGRERLVSREFFADPDWPLRAAEMLRVLKPLNDFINYSLFEE